MWDSSGLLVNIQKVPQKSEFCLTNKQTNKQKLEYVHFRIQQATFFNLGWFLKKLADDQLMKGSIYYIKHMPIKPTFYHGSGLTWNWTGKWKYLLCLILAHTAFLLSNSELLSGFQKASRNCASFQPYFSLWEYDTKIYNEKSNVNSKTSQ